MGQTEPVGAEYTAPVTPLSERLAALRYLRFLLHLSQSNSSTPASVSCQIVTLASPPSISRKPIVPCPHEHSCGLPGDAETAELRNVRAADELGVHVVGQRGGARVGAEHAAHRADVLDVRVAVHAHIQPLTPARTVTSLRASEQRNPQRNIRAAHGKRRSRCWPTHSHAAGCSCNAAPFGVNAQPSENSRQHAVALTSSGPSPSCRSSW